MGQERRRGGGFLETSASCPVVQLVLEGVTHAAASTCLVPPLLLITTLFHVDVSPFACLPDVCNVQVVFTLVEPAGDMYALPGDLIDANEWVRVFLRTGGMQHLLMLLRKDGGIDPSQVVRIHAPYRAGCDVVAVQF